MITRSGMLINMTVQDFFLKAKHCVLGRRVFLGLIALLLCRGVWENPFFPDDTYALCVTTWCFILTFMIIRLSQIDRKCERLVFRRTFCFPASEKRWWYY